MKISIIIPNYNGGKFLIECLKSIYTNTKVSFEVTLVDNHSLDHSQTRAKYRYPSIKLLQFPDNQGFSKAVNRGIKESPGDYFLILNNDTRLEKDTLFILQKAISSDKKIGLVGGKIVDLKGKYCSPGFRLAPYLGFLIYDKTGTDKPKEIEWISGCAMLIRKEVFDKIGLLDEKYFFYFEDTDFCIRARKAGYKILYEPKAKITHLGGKSSKNINRKYLDYYLYQGKFRNLFKNGTILQIISSCLIQMIIFPYKSLVAKTGLIQIKAFIWAFKNK